MYTRPPNMTKAVLSSPLNPLPSLFLLKTSQSTDPNHKRRSE